MSMSAILDRINIFPHELTNRASWDGRRQVHTCYGTACTILYVLIMFAFVTYYTIPVFNNEKPSLAAVTKPTGVQEELYYRDIGPLYFNIEYGFYTANHTYSLNRSIIDVYINHTEATYDDQGV